MSSYPFSCHSVSSLLPFSLTTYPGRDLKHVTKIQVPLLSTYCKLNSVKVRGRRRRQEKTLHGWGSTPYVSSIWALCRKFRSDVSGVCPLWERGGEQQRTKHLSVHRERSKCTTRIREGQRRAEFRSSHHSEVLPRTNTRLLRKVGGTLKSHLQHAAHVT